MSQINYLRKRKKLGENYTSIDSAMFLKYRGIMLRYFEYENLPEDLDPVIVEQIYFEFGEALGFKYGGHYFFLPIAPRGKLNLYGYLVKARPLPLNGDSRFPIVNVMPELDKAGNIIEPNAIHFWNNSSRTPTAAFIAPFITRIDYIWKTIGREEALARTGFIVECSDPEKKDALKNEIQLLMQLDTPIAVVDKGTASEFSAALKTGDIRAAENIKASWDDMTNTKHLLDTILGINNANTSKRERLNVSEVEVNDQEIELMIRDELKCRQEQWDKFNKLFGTNVKVKIAVKEESETIQKIDENITENNEED